MAAEEPSLLPEDVRKRWRIIPLFSAGVVYDDNIFLTNENRVADVIWNISAGLAFELGDFRGKGENYLTGYWLGIPLIYTNNPEQNAFNYSAALIGQYRWNRLVGQDFKAISIMPQDQAGRSTQLLPRGHSPMPCGSNMTIARKPALICNSRKVTRSPPIPPGLHPR